VNDATKLVVAASGVPDLRALQSLNKTAQACARPRTPFSRARAATGVFLTIEKTTREGIMLSPIASTGRSEYFCAHPNLRPEYAELSGKPGGFYERIHSGR
jgi:hypothetical protein